jgi:hypothetical protein
MRVSSVLLVALVVLLAGVTAPVGAVGTSPTVAGTTVGTDHATAADASEVVQQETPNGTNETTEASDDESDADDATGFGSQISSFMQSSSTETSGAVESQLWHARLNRTDSGPGVSETGPPASVVERRVSVLESRLAEVRESRERLAAARANGSISAVAYRARLARLNGQLSALETAVDRARPVAASAGVNESRLSDLDAEIDAERGPPAHAGNRSAQGGAEGNGNGPPDAGDGRPGTGAGPPGNAPDADRGNSGNPDAGNGSDRGTADEQNETASGDDRGNAGNDGNRGNAGNGNDNAGNDGTGDRAGGPNYARGGPVGSE